MGSLSHLSHFSANTSRRFLLPVGIRSPGFSRLTATRLYAVFIRPRFEYGLCICTFVQKQLALLDRAQDQCLRLAFGGHPRASTTVFKHLTNTPSMVVRAHTLVLKMIIRVHPPNDCLLAKLVPFVTATPVKSRFRWPSLLRQNPLWSDSQYTGGYTSVDDRLVHFSSNASVKQSVLAYRTNLLHRILHRQDPPVLLSACRPSLGIDGVFLVPMLLSDRSRILRWRMGWLPARPIDCSCGPVHASRSHLLSCLRVAERLNLPLDIKPNSLDYVLNLLPRKLPAYPSQALYSRWSSWWPVICQVLLEIEQICQPDGTFTGPSIDTSGSLFLNKIQPLQLPSAFDPSFLVQGQD
ncbi:hypothetical protein G6F56_011092 [Rhizopus delemar]|nr:hypothetical protein G6F56_011092 [Rhizopus delemar]